MIREFKKTDTEQVMQIWLNGNVDAHPFIPKEYWESHFEMVQKQIVQAEVYVYEENNIVHGFIGMQEDYIAGIFVRKDYRGQGIAGHLLNMAVNDLKAKDISPLYLVTDHIGFYESYGWEFLCMVQGDGEPEMTRMYIHQ